MTRSIFAVPNTAIARKIIDAAPAAGMFGKQDAADTGLVVVLDHDDAYREKAETLVRSFLPSARLRSEPSPA